MKQAKVILLLLAVILSLSLTSCGERFQKDLTTDNDVTTETVILNGSIFTADRTPIPGVTVKVYFYDETVLSQVSRLKAKSLSSADGKYQLQFNITDSEQEIWRESKGSAYRICRYFIDYEIPEKTASKLHAEKEYFVDFDPTGVIGLREDVSFYIPARREIEVTYSGKRNDIIECLIPYGLDNSTIFSTQICRSRGYIGLEDRVSAWDIYGQQIGWNVECAKSMRLTADADPATTSVSFALNELNSICVNDFSDDCMTATFSVTPDYPRSIEIDPEGGIILQ